MDTRNGRIYTEKELNEMKKITREALNPFLKPMTMQSTPIQMKRRPPRIGRNEPCPCGSGLKFKKCCRNKAELI